MFMHVLEFNLINTITPGLVLIVLIATLALRLPAAILDHRALKRQQAHGRFTNTIYNDVTRSAVRRESLRVLALAVMVGACTISFTNVEDAVEIRNASFALVALLMAFNTTYDWLSQRRAIAQITNEKETRST
jgi:hypothetical protein